MKPRLVDFMPVICYMERHEAAAQLLPDACLSYINNEIENHELDNYDTLDSLREAINQIYIECQEILDSDDGYKKMLAHLKAKKMESLAEAIHETIIYWEEETEKQAEADRIKAKAKRKADALQADADATEQLTLL